MSDLKPCPFCGSPAIAVNLLKRFAIHCTSIKCRGQQKDDLAKKEETIRAWNTRADAAELAALRAERDALKEELNATREQARPFIAALLKRAESISDDDPLADLMEALTQDRDALRARAERAESDAAESKRRCGELAELLESVWSGVLEMKKDARTDYELPRLAQLDLESILSHSARVAAALTPEASK